VWSFASGWSLQQQAFGCTFGPHPNRGQILLGHSDILKSKGGPRVPSPSFLLMEGFLAPRCRPGMKRTGMKCQLFGIFSTRVRRGVHSPYRVVSGPLSLGENRLILLNHCRSASS